MALPELFQEIGGVFSWEHYYLGSMLGAPSVENYHFKLHPSKAPQALTIRLVEEVGERSKNDISNFDIGPWAYQRGKKKKASHGVSTRLSRLCKLKGHVIK